EDEVVLVEAGWPGVVGTRQRRVEDEFSGEAFEAGRGCGCTDQLLEIDQARLPIGVRAADQRRKRPLELLDPFRNAGALRSCKCVEQELARFARWGGHVGLAPAARQLRQRGLTSQQLVAET